MDFKKIFFFSQNQPSGKLKKSFKKMPPPRVLTTLQHIRKRAKASFVKTLQEFNNSGLFS
ncbi:MAG: hypothetical protein JWQ25_2289 [Daejeonella sp.]|nr:hypothetical protein [Daejeonella sp.]